MALDEERMWDLSESFKIGYHYFKVVIFVHSTSATASDHPISRSGKVHLEYEISPGAENRLLLQLSIGFSDGAISCTWEEDSPLPSSEISSCKRTRARHAI